MSDQITPEPLLKKPEIKRDLEGRFERHGKALSKTQKKRKPAPDAVLKHPNSEHAQIINKQRNIELKSTLDELTIGTGKRGPGRPKGSQNKITLGLKEAILAAADDAGGEEGLRGYLRILAIENSSAFAGLLGKVLPSTLAMPETNDGKATMVSFQRVIVWPDGHREIEGVTPKQLPRPLPSDRDMDGNVIGPETVTKTDIEGHSE